MLLKPKGVLADYVQGIWSVAIDQQSQLPFSRWLQGDACSGVIFNLGAPISVNDQMFNLETIMLPVSKKAQHVNLPKGSQLVGIRFQEGVSANLFGQIFSKATAISETNIDMKLGQLATELAKAQSHFYRLRLLYRWALETVDSTKQLPNEFLTTLKLLQQDSSVEQLMTQIEMSQRQIERHYRKLLDMTPAQYLRLMRVNRALQSLKQSPQIALATLALQSGFSDQSHMTREFKSIAEITPFKYLKKISGDVDQQ